MLLKYGCTTARWENASFQSLAALLWRSSDGWSTLHLRLDLFLLPNRLALELSSLALGLSSHLLRLSLCLACADSCDFCGFIFELHYNGVSWSDVRLCSRY